MSKIVCTCYGKKFEFDSIETAMIYFSEAMANSEGSEQNRYTSIFMQLSQGNTVCSDIYCTL